MTRRAPSRIPRTGFLFPGKKYLIGQLVLPISERLDSVEKLFKTFLQLAFHRRDRFGNTLIDLLTLKLSDRRAFEKIEFFGCASYFDRESGWRF